MFTESDSHRETPGKPVTHDNLTQVVWGHHKFALVLQAIFPAFPTIDPNNAGKSLAVPEEGRGGAVHDAAGAGSTGEWCFKGSEVIGDVFILKQTVWLKEIPLVSSNQSSE